MVATVHVDLSDHAGGAWPVAHDPRRCLDCPVGVPRGRRVADPRGQAGMPWLRVSPSVPVVPIPDEWQEKHL